MDGEVTVGVHVGGGTPMVTSTDGRRARRSRTSARTQRGAVAAEAAAVLPALVAVAMGLVWVVALAATQVRVVDAAREAARAAARGEADGTAVERGRQVAPEGTRFAVTHSGDHVEVTAEASVRGPGGLFTFLPMVEVSSTASAAEEPR